MTRLKLTPIEKQLNAYLKWSKDVRRNTPATMQTKSIALRYFINTIGVTNIEELTNKKFDAWVEKRMQGKIGSNRRSINPNSVRTQIAYIVAWFGWMRDMDYKLNIKTKMIITPKLIPSKRKWYTSENIAEVLDHCEYLLDEVMIRVLFDTGLRASEFAQLKISDIDDRTIYVIGKGQKHGWVYISRETKNRLDLWIKMAKIQNYLWIKGTKRYYYEPLTTDGIRKRLKAVFSAAGFPNFQMHEMRHSFATDLRRRGADIDVIQKLMRHANLQVTQRYLHNLDGDMALEWDKLKNYNLAKNIHKDVIYIRGKEIRV